MRANARVVSAWLARSVRRALPTLLLLLAPLAQAQDAVDPMATEAAGEPVLLELDPADRARLDALPALRVIADPQAAPVSFVDGSGRYVGLVPDYLVRMAELLGVRLQAVPTRNWQEALQRFDAGEADLIAPIAITPDRQARMRFSQPLVSFRAVVMARREQPVVGQFQALLGLRFAQIAGSSESRRLRERYPQLAVQDYADFREALQAVSAGQADAILSNPAVLRYQSRQLLIGNLHVVAASDEPARQHHLAVLPERAWLLPLLDRAYAAIPESAKNEIRRRWLDEDERTGPQVLLSAAERDWLAAHAELRIGYSPSAPITFRDSEGQAAGQAVELVNEICRRAGLRPDWRHYDTWAEALAALDRREIDALGSVSATRMANGDPLSRGYMPLQNGLFLHEDAPLASRIQMLGGDAVVVAVSTSSALTALRTRHPMQPMLEVASVDEQLEALRDGRAAAAVGNLALLDYEIRRRQLRDLRIGGLFDSPAEAKLAVRADHPLTLAVLDKAIATLSAEQRDAILDRWFRLEQDPIDPWRTARLVAGVLLPALAGLAFLGYWALRLRREVRARKQAEEGLREAQAQLTHALARTQGQFQAILDHAPMAIWAKDLDGRYVQANRAYATLFGLQDQSPLGRRDRDLWPEEAVDRFRREDVAVIASGEPHRQLDRSLPGTEGGDRHVLKLKFPIRDAGGAVLAVGGIALDVTEQEQLREQLELRNRRLALREEQLLRLSSSTAVDDGDLREAYALIAEAATTSLDAERASVWYLDAAREHIVCQWLHDRGRGRSAEPLKLSRGAFPAYFAAIEQERILAAHEARHDPRTAAFTDSYLEPLGIESMLDVAIRHHGQTIGVICIEHDAPRRWSDEDASFAGALADLVARALTASERHRADEELRRMNASLEQTVADRTARARAAERLAQERADKIEAVQQRLRRITDASPGALYQFRRSAEGVYSFPFMSAGVEELIGIDWRTATQDAGRVFAAVHPPDVPELLHSIETSAAAMQPYVYVFRVPQREGGMRWVQARSRPSRDADGGITWDGFLADVTESREQAALVEEAQQRLQKITDSIAGLVYEYRRAPDGSDSASFISDGVGQLIGVSREAVLADVRRFFAVVLPEDLPGYTADILASAEENRDHRYSFRIRHAATGEIRWLYSSARAPQREQGALVWRGYVIDITEQKRLQEQLGLARDEADQASRAKSEFLANMSHEIRTPMNAIIGLSHLALQTELSTRQHDYLGKIHHSAQSLLGIINDILDLSKIEAGKLAVEHSPFDLFEVLDSLASLVGVRAQDKGLEFLIATARDLPYRLLGDALRIGQVLLNLAGNAVKFTERGQVLLRVLEEPDSRADGGLRLRFELSDTGIGMTPEQVGKLFQSFSQADASTTRKYGGTGLGLSISRQLVELMGGRIGVDSTPGEGSTFWFVLPLGLAPEQRRLGEPVPLDGRQALVVDDNASAREIVENYLTGFGMRVTQAAGGEAAVEAARAALAAGAPFDLAVLDWQMPGLDGIATARALRGLESPPKIILLTAHGREEVARQAEDERLDGFLVKPVNPSLLLDTSLQALFGRGMPGGGARRPRGFGDPQRNALRGVSVLLAEDNEINQQVAREVLEGFGAAVDIAGNGRIALERLRAGGRYDVVLMDMQMPEMDGLAATRAIRADPALPRLPILAMTANAMEEDRRACLDAGMDDFLSKPFRPVELLRLLRHWLYGESASAQAAAVTDPQVFNRRDGLARVGSEAVLQRLVAQLLASAPLPPLEAALAAGATGEAQRQIHSLAGSTGLLGFERLHGAARALERRLRSGGDAAPALAELRAAWAEAAALTGVPQPAPAPPDWQQPDPALLAALAQQIEAWDSQANESLDALRAACGASPPPVLGALERALAEFDFAAAAALLPAVRAVLEEGRQ